MPKSETHIQNEIRMALIDRGFWVMKIHGGPYQPAGIPDLLAIKEGRAHWIEVKQPGGATTKIQERQMDVLEKAGCRVGVADNLKDALAIVGES